jgi:hypothetical protein
VRFLQLRIISGFAVVIKIWNSLLWYKNNFIFKIIYGRKILYKIYHNPAGEVEFINKQG